jgi:hypothetical protein
VAGFCVATPQLAAVAASLSYALSPEGSIAIALVQVEALPYRLAASVTRA